MGGQNAGVAEAALQPQFQVWLCPPHSNPFPSALRVNLRQVSNCHRLLVVDHDQGQSGNFTLTGTGRVLGSLIWCSPPVGREMPRFVGWVLKLCCSEAAHVIGFVPPVVVFSLVGHPLFLFRTLLMFEVVQPCVS